MMKTVKTRHGLDQRSPAAKDEATATFIDSSETPHLLAACFDNLKNASSFTDIGFEYRDVESEGSDCYNLVLFALAVVGFPRKIATFRILPQDVPGHRYRALTLSPQTYSPYIKGLHIDTPKLQFLQYMNAKAKQERRGAKVRNDTGYHFRNYSPCHSKLFDFLNAMHQVEALEIDECETFPRLRFCNGCHDLFAKHIAITHYPNLTDPTIKSVYISGGRLRRFIEKHSSTLTQVSCTFASLTDGSWRSIAQGLLKLP
jgi:hypothetical protein